jgi:ferric-dicitrate binding protein FerR (iron transport regulator)
VINRENIDELISRFLSGEASPEEAMLLEDWKLEAPENLAHYEQSERVFALLENAGRPAETDPAKAWEKVKPLLDREKVKPLYPKTAFTRMAAALIILLGIGVGLVLLFNTDQKGASYVADQTPKDIKLKDGSEVTVFAHSSLTADAGFGKTNRLMHLNGDATFSVVHDESMPFVIDAGNVFIKDIGTRFTVRSSIDTDTVYVHVDEGIVLLFDSLGSALEIRATEHALYIRSKKQIVKNETTVARPNAQLSFSNKPLGDVIATLNATYNTAIILQHESLKHCTITTRFEHEDLDTIISIITETLGLSYEKTATGYLIKGNTCHS